MINWRWERSTIRRTLCCAISLASVALLAGCGTLAAPVMQVATATAEVIIERQADATATFAPSATPLPPTETPTPTSTITPTPIPTATPEPTSAPVLSPFERLVAVRDPFNGAMLFGTFQDAANYACSNCHLSDSEKENLGPGLLNIKDRAANRVEGMSAAEYIYQSIVDSKSYTVEGFDPYLMPQRFTANWRSLISSPT